MTKKPFMALALCAGLTVAVFAAPAAPAKKAPVTVGQFAVQVASALGYEARDQKGAQQTLRALGVNLAPNLGAPLTEGVVAKIMADLGVSVVAPAKPETPVSVSRASFVAGMLGQQSSLSTEDIEPPPFPNEPPTQCLSSVDRGHCVDCCIAAVGPLPDPGGGTRTAGKECGRYCQDNVVPPISDEQPVP